MSVNENHIDHEVRIRILENIAKGIEGRFNRLEDKIDSHFKWTLGTMLLLIVTVITFMATIVFK
jgi:hypothetical protein